MAELQASLHSHCASCYKLWCNVQDAEGVSCVNIRCPQECGLRLHTCKIPDHLTRCPNSRIECFNKINGCPATMTRRTAALHLMHCPANVVQCGLEFRMDDFKRHFRSGAEHDHHCEPILAEKIGRKVAAEKLAEEAEYDSSLPADNYEIVSEEKRAKMSEMKRRKREMAMRMHGSLLAKPGSKRPTDELRKVPWQGRAQSISEDISEMPLQSPTSLLEDMETSPLSPTSPTSPLPSDPSLDTLPFPVLKHIGRFLDPKDLSALAVTSQFLRRVCSSLLQECGMVTFGWEKQVDESWVVTQKIWKFAVDPSSH